MNRRNFIKNLAAGVFIASVAPGQLLVGEEMFYPPGIDELSMFNIVRLKVASTEESVPVGYIVNWHGTEKTIPVGFAICNGARIDKLKYPEAYKKMDGILPDTRWLFVSKIKT